MSFASRWSGKVKMILQSITIPIVILLVVDFRASQTAWAMWTCHVLVYLTLIVSVWSGLPYILGVGRMINEAGPGKGRSVAGTSREAENP